MAIETIHFCGLLGNVDSSILKVHLDHGFKIGQLSIDECVQFVAKQERTTESEAGSKIFMTYPCLNVEEQCCYLITNSFEADIEFNPDGTVKPFPPELMQFQMQLHDGYLVPTLRLIRLYKEGNICLPITYRYAQNPAAPFAKSRGEKSSSIRRDLFSIQESEILELQQFIQTTKLPFTNPHLELALENFEVSCSVQDDSLSFLSLMIAMEVLLNPGDSELTYRVSRNTAVLLGKDKADAESVFAEIKRLYGKRSKIVHTGKKNIIGKDDLLRLRHYVRESIKEAYKINKSKEDLLSLLNSHGFGERVN